MHVYMLKRNNGLYYDTTVCWGAKEAGTVWTHKRRAEIVQQRSIFSCRVVPFNLEPVEPVKCPTCCGTANVAHGPAQCIKVLKSEVKKLTQQLE